MINIALLSIILTVAHMADLGGTGPASSSTPALLARRPRRPEPRIRPLPKAFFYGPLVGASSGFWTRSEVWGPFL